MRPIETITFRFDSRFRVSEWTVGFVRPVDKDATLPSTRAAVNSLCSVLDRVYGATVKYTEQQNRAEVCMWLAQQVAGGYLFEAVERVGGRVPDGPTFAEWLSGKTLF